MPRPATPARPALRRRSVLAGLLAAGAATAAGCAPGESTRPSGGGTGPSETATPSDTKTPVPSTSPGGPRMPGNLLLSWLTTGGIAGVHRETLLYEDGGYTLSTRDEPSRTGRIPAEDADRVRALLEEADLGRRPRRSTGPGADRFQYRIAYDGHVVYRDETTLGEPLRKVAGFLPSQ